MLAVVKKPHIELSLNGEGAYEALAWLARKFDVIIIEGTKDSVSIESTDFWREMRGNRVGNLLAAARMKKGITQKQLAEAAEIKQNMVSDYEKGRRRLTRQMAARFAALLDVAPERFVHEDEESAARTYLQHEAESYERRN